MGVGETISLISFVIGGERIAKPSDEICEPYVYDKRYVQFLAIGNVHENAIKSVIINSKIIN